MSKVATYQVYDVLLEKSVRNIVGVFMSVKFGSIDVIILYRLLKLIYENEGISPTKLHEVYRTKYGVKVNYNVIKRHVEYAASKELISISGGKPAMLKITKKGIDYMFLMSQIEKLLGEGMA